MGRHGFRAHGIAVYGAVSEELIHFTHDGAGFTFIECSIEVLQLLERKASLGAGVAIFLHQQGLSTRASQRVNEIDKRGGVAAQPLIERASGVALFRLVCRFDLIVRT